MNRVAVVFTPYSVRTGLVSVLLNEIARNKSHSIILRRGLTLTREDVEVFYPKMTTRDYFPLIVKCLTDGEAEVVIILTEDLHSEINQIKGSFRHNNGVVLATGLRQKHQKDNHTFEFILRITDSNSETDEIGGYLFGEEYCTMLEHAVKSVRS